MASGLSEDEFQRLQLQLLDLRTQNYSLEDNCQRQDKELNLLREQCETLDKELVKATKTINKSKKAKEVEILLQENEAIQRKLCSQEEEFRLQNETLMQELQNLVTVNENLEKENKLYKSGSTVQKNDAATASLQDDVRRLQAQNAALQKNLTSCQESYEDELNSLKQTIQDLEQQCDKLAGRRTGPVGEGSTERTVEGQADPGMISEDHMDGLADNLEDCVNDNHQVLPSVINTSPKTGNQLTKELNDLRLSIDVEREEKKLLREQLTIMDNDHREKRKELQEELDKLTEKYRKKQESLFQLQEEKESMYGELSQKLETTRANRDREVQLLTDQCRHLKEQIGKINRNFDEHKEKAGRRLRELDHMCVTLREQLDTSSLENTLQMQEENEQFREQLQELSDLEQALRQEKEDLLLQLKESQKAAGTTLEQLYDAQQERDKQIQALQELNKVAEKRKKLLDDLAIKYQAESDLHRDTIKTMEEENRRKVEALTAEIEKLRVQVAELELVAEQYEQLQTTVSGLEESKGWLERRLDEAETTTKATKEEYEMLLAKEKEEHKAAISQLQEEQLQKTQELEEKIESLKKDREELEERIIALKQEIKDSIDDKRIHEKKGASILKDLKRQLQAERKRAEKLQERLQEALSDSKNRPSMEELFRPIDPNDHYRGDNSSVSSYSMSGLSKDAPQSPGSGTETPPSVLEQENNNLVVKLAELQQEKWMMEEKVSHLESSNAAMADDLLKKQAIISYYVMDSKIEPHHGGAGSERMTLKRVMDFVKDKGDQNLREINQKLQRMLEETLTKNMHLQKDLETLSEEVVRLSKIGSNTSVPKTKVSGGQ